MAKIPLRILGLFLLAVALSVATCQAFFHGLPIPREAPFGQHDGDAAR